MSGMAGMDRRGFLCAVVAGGAGLLLGFHGDGRAAAGEASQFSTWLSIGTDGLVTVYNTTAELGQGAATPLTQVMAEELALDPAQLRVEQAPLSDAYLGRNPTGATFYVTWGSSGSRLSFGRRRRAAAAARMMLVQAAAARWNVPVAECSVAKGRVLHAASARSLGYGELAAEAARLPVPAKVELTPRAQWVQIGKPVQRRDLPDKTDGSARYGIDTSLPGMLTATIAQCPVIGGKLLSVDAAPAMRVRGVKQVVKLANAVAVVATGYWQAKQGLAALKPVWDAGPYRANDSAAHRRAMRAAIDQPLHTVAPKPADAEAIKAAHAAGMAMAGQQLDAVYEAPFLAHAPLEPMNGTALVKDGGAELWLPTQYQSMTREVVAEALGMRLERVVINTTLAGGGFGRRIEADFALQAARIALAMPGSPVKLIWSREEDMTQGYYRGAAMARLRAGLDAQGMPLAFAFDTACPTIADYSIEGRHQPKGELDNSGGGYAAEMPYSLPGLRERHTPVDLGVPVTFWRSVHASTNGYFLEAFIDEMAAVAQADPLDYRRRLLAGKARPLAVLDKLADVSGWRMPAPAGRHRGVAFYQGNGSVVAMVVELETGKGVGKDKQVRLRRICCVADVGVALNPDGVRAQVQGGIVFALSAALAGEITVKDGKVQQTNFGAYPLLSMAQTPAIDVHIMEGSEAMGGIGEESVPQVAPAIAGALFAATGERIRALPFSRHGWRFV